MRLPGRLENANEFLRGVAGVCQGERQDRIERTTSCRGLRHYTGCLANVRARRFSRARFGSSAALRSERESITCYQGENLKAKRKTWETIEGWIRSEIGRLSFLYSPSGQRLVSEEYCLPDSEDAQLI